MGHFFSAQSIQYPSAFFLFFYTDFSTSSYSDPTSSGSAPFGGFLRGSQWYRSSLGTGKWARVRERGQQVAAPAFLLPITMHAQWSQFPLEGAAPPLPGAQSAKTGLNRWPHPSSPDHFLAAIVVMWPENTYYRRATGLQKMALFAAETDRQADRHTHTCRTGDHT